MTDQSVAAAGTPGDPAGVPLPDLAADTLGGAAVLANDEFFAQRENLVRARPPVWDADRYTDRGKWMDGWETRRRREPGHDWCIVRLGTPGVIRQAVVDTAHFTGNFPEAASLEGTYLPHHAGPDDLAGAEWVELLPRTPLAGDTANRFSLTAEVAVSHVRLNIFPDGGVARLRLHGEAVPDWVARTRGGQRVDTASIPFGGRVLDVSDRHYNDPGKLLQPAPSRGMHDGWETARRRAPGNEWVVIDLGAPTEVAEVVVDTAHYKGNAPGWSVVSARPTGGEWQELLPRTALRPDTAHRFDAELAALGPVDEVRVDILPDGGLARVRVIGTVPATAVTDLARHRLNVLPRARAVTELRSCCGATVWAEQVADRRPFASVDDLRAAADEVWVGLDRRDRLEAFAAHPRIGEREAARPTGATARRWSDREQAGVADADRTALAEVNRAYEDRFGWVFLICASGLDGETILARARERLGNDPDTELGIAAEEQRRITQLRIDRLLGMEEAT